MHFKTDDFYLTKTGRRFLKNSAVPYSDPLQLTAEDRRNTPTSLDDEEISDSESLLDSPQKIQLKNDLRKALAAKKALTKKVKMLQRQNRHLKRKNENLTSIVKALKTKSSVNKEILINIKEEVDID